MWGRYTFLFAKIGMNVRECAMKAKNKKKIRKKYRSFSCFIIHWRWRRKFGKRSNGIDGVMCLLLELPWIATAKNSHEKKKKSDRNELCIAWIICDLNNVTAEHATVHWFNWRLCCAPFVFALRRSIDLTFLSFQKKEKKTSVNDEWTELWRVSFR